jgi:hypothetical protein
MLKAHQLKKLCKRGRKSVAGPHIFLNARWMLLISFPTSNNRRNEKIYLDNDWMIDINLLGLSNSFNIYIFYFDKLKNKAFLFEFLLFVVNIFPNLSAMS